MARSKSSSKPAASAARGEITQSKINSAGESETSSIASWKARLYLGLVCFFAWGCVMVIEICAYRLLAPLFGNSVYTWTALIGVVLIASSVGGYLGGWLSDRRLALDLLGWLLIGAAVLVFFIPPLHSLLGPRLITGGLIVGPVVTSLLLLAMPGILLGAVGPAATRFYSLTRQDSRVGASAGVVSMLGSLGSFTGTFLAGFVLLANFSVRGIFFGVGLLLTLLAMGGFFLARNSMQQMLPLLLAAGMAAGFSFTGEEPPPADVLFQKETYYHRIRVSEDGRSPYKKRVLELDNTQEGGINPDTQGLILQYQQFWQLARLPEQARIDRALFLGAGAFGMPNHVSKEFPEARVDVVEIDPAVIEVGREFFFLNDHPHVTAHAGDARRFVSLQDATTRWDLIFGDAYNGVRAIPSHLTTREFFEQISAHLTDDGVFLMNIICTLQGPRSELLQGMLTTLRSVFPQVEVFAVHGRGPNPQNLILLASRRDWQPVLEKYYPAGSIQARMVSTRVPPNQLPANGPIYTDDRNPVDAIIARTLRTL
ncbi:MAG: fused MFS/spermidine synthase [Verrucomicrobiales bacterium]|nr:fused MFS/spermidine synthase [Verrucomicrobiales bacterium]